MIFKLNPRVIVVMLFTLLQVNSKAQTGDKIYGLMNTAGPNNGGAIISMNPDGSQLTVEHGLDYVNIERPWFNQLIELDSGQLYGTSFYGGLFGAGSLYKYDYTKDSIKILHNFGDNPFGKIIYSKSLNKLFGITGIGQTANSGKIYEYDLSSNQLTVKKSINHNNSGSNSELFIMKNDRIIGNSGNILFEYLPALDSIHILHNTPQSLKIFHEIDSNRILVSGFSIYEYNLTSDSLTLLKNLGMTPKGFTHTGNDVFVGVASKFGVSDSYCIRYDYSNNGLDTLYTFSISGPYGSQPNDFSVIDSNTLIGSSYSGGPNNGGTIFQLKLDSLIFTKLFDLPGSNPNLSAGIQPTSRFTKGRNGKYYIANARGDFNLICNTNGGTLIEINESLDSISPKVDFGCSQRGAFPISRPIKIGDNIFGINGTSFSMFKFNVRSKNYTPLNFLMYFKKAHLSLGRNSDLIILSEGQIPNFSGRLMRLDTNFMFNSSFNFNNTTGTSPRGELLSHSNGKYYGCGSAGGANNGGTIFEYDPVLDTVFAIHSFSSTSSSGSSPLSYLVENKFGNLIGITTQGGLNQTGTIFEYDLNNNNVSKLTDNPSLAGSSSTSLFGISKLDSNNIIGVISKYNNTHYLYRYNHQTNTYRILDSINYFNSVVHSYDPPRLESDSNLYFSLEGSIFGSGIIARYLSKDDSIEVVNDFMPFNINHGINLSGIFFDSNISTGISESIKESNNLEIFPNPFKDRAYIESKSKIKSYVLFDLSGKIIDLNENFNQDKLVIKGNIEAGIYFLKLVSRNGNSTIKLIKY